MWNVTGLETDQCAGIPRLCFSNRPHLTSPRGNTNLHHAALRALPVLENCREVPDNRNANGPSYDAHDPKEVVLVTTQLL